MQTTIIKDVSLAYPKLATAQPNQFGAKQFEVRIDFSAERIAELQPFSRQTVRPADVDGMLSINVRLPEFNRNGKANSVKVIDMKGKDLTPTQIMEMGNGTKANVMVLQYENRKDGKMSTQLKAIQVIEYKKYELESINFDVVEDTTTTEFNNQF